MNRLRPLMFAAAAALSILGCSDTASAQPQLVVTPATTPANPMVFNNIPGGGISSSQAVTVKAANATLATVIIQTNVPWLVVSPGPSVNIPVSLSVQCNTSNLVPGSYSGSFTVTVDGAPTDFSTIYVSLTVSGVSQLSATPSSLPFSAEYGAAVGTPASTQVQIASSGGPLAYTLQAVTNGGGNWLLLSATSGNTSGPPFTVSVNAASLTPTAFPAIYQGYITAASTTTADTVIINVQLTVTANGVLNVTPVNLSPFLYQFGTGTDPAQQMLSVTSSQGTIAFSVQESPQVPWLVVSPLAGNAGSLPDNIALNVTPVEQALQPNTYTTNLIVTPIGGSPLPAIPVTLFVAAHPIIQLQSNALSFTSSFGGPQPATSSMTVTASGSANVPFTVSSNQSWLSATASTTTTPATLTVQVNTTGLAVNNYTGVITITPNNGDTYTQLINVTLSVTNAVQVTAGPPILLFSYEIGQAAPPGQVVQIQSNTSSVVFSVVTNTSSCPGNWLGATQSGVTTNATITVGVNVAGMTPGTCSGTVTLTYSNGTGPATLPIQVTLAVSAAPELVVEAPPGFGVVNGTLGGAPFQQQLTLISTDPANQVNYNAAIINAPGGWLGIIGSTSGTTPQNLTIQIAPGAVANPGVYSGNLQITSASLPAVQFSIPITLTVTTTTTVSVSPPTLSFTETQGGAASPSVQTLTVTSSPGQASFATSVNYTNGGNWLQISPMTGGSNSTIQVSVVPNHLIAGTYPAQISFTFQGAATQSAIINVTLTVTPPQSVTVTPPSLGFSYTIGGPLPPVQQLAIASTGGSANVAVTVTSGSWLSVDTTGGATPQTVNVSVNPQGLAAQAPPYTGTISISSPGVLAAPISVPVSFTVTAPPSPQPIVILNNATNVSGVIAPGEEIAIKGNFLGPANPANGTLFSLNSNGTVPSTLAGVQVTFDNNPGTPIYVSANQINVIVPYEINGRLSTTMSVSYNGISSPGIQLEVANSSPGLFTNNFSGTGQVAALNQDGSFNGTGAGFAAAGRNTVIQLFGTGGGQTNPITQTGTVIPIPANQSQFQNLPNVTANIGGLPATVIYGGDAPGLVSGVIQVNAIIPAGVTPGPSVPVYFSVNGIFSPIGTTIAVQ